MTECSKLAKWVMPWYHMHARWVRAAIQLDVIGRAVPSVIVVISLLAEGSNPAKGARARRI